MKFLLLFIILILSIKFSISLETWRDKSAKFWHYANNFEKVKCSNTIDDNCDNLLLTSNFMKKKSDETPNNDPSSHTMTAFQDLEEKKAKIIPYYHSTHSMLCSCGMEFQLLDLGPLYYPRYLHTGICKQESCGGLFRCSERHYKVKVLKQRDLENSENAEIMALPESLRESWESEIISVTVACECSP